MYIAVGFTDDVRGPALVQYTIYKLYTKTCLQ
jgi:hypothetical protein